MIAIKFWKPYGVMTQFTDKEGRPTLADYVKIPNIYAAGRLDLDSEGLLILTDDGRLNAMLTQPEYEHPRTYWVQVEGEPTPQAIRQLREGVMLKDGMTRPTQARHLKEEPKLPPRAVPIRERKSIPTSWIELVLTEGRNRQVRRMTAAVGLPTLRLVRVAVGEVSGLDLEVGEWVELTPKELLSVQRSVKRR